MKTDYNVRSYCDGKWSARNSETSEYLNFHGGHLSPLRPEALKGLKPQGKDEKVHFQDARERCACKALRGHHDGSTIR